MKPFKRRTILCFFGTRPEAIKMAPVVAELKKKENWFRTLIAVSAQHRELLDQALRPFSLKVDFDLNIMKEGQSLFDLTSRALLGFKKILSQRKVDFILVHGDTTTTLAGALAAYYQKIPLGHVEAGLRTHDQFHPFPEEMNRRLTDALSNLHFAPTQKARQNLLNEGVSPSSVFVTGNTVIDAVKQVADRKDKGRVQALINRLLNEKKRIILLTAHRRENFGEPFLNICKAVLALSRSFPTTHWIYPVHLNPHVYKPAHRWLSKKPNIHLWPPLAYGDLVSVLKASSFVVTDSGGLQEEAPSLGKPVLVLRYKTERPEAVRAGTVQVIGTEKKRIVSHVSTLLRNQAVYRRMARAANPYGDGHAAERIVHALGWFFGMTEQKPLPFGAKKT